MKLTFNSLIVGIVVLCISGNTASAQEQASNDETILHAWCWSFNTIKNNMKKIADSGFSFVQTSPANTCFVGEDGAMQIMGHGKWYYHYQPTDWQIGNYQLGSRDEFIEMCKEAKKYGVRVLVDILPNHTGFDTTAVKPAFLEAVGGYENLYHANGLNEIKDYNDRYECTTGAVGGLPDVNTENPDFQYYFLQYVNDLIACGADGFRYDTAKHIGLPSDPLDKKSKVNDFWDVATGRKAVKGLMLDKSKDLFVYGEVLQDKNVKEDEYAEYFGMCASNYGYVIRRIIADRSATADELANWQHSVDPRKLTTWVESHDTYCNANESASLTDTQIRLGWVIITARQFGTPLFYSRPANSSRENFWGDNLMGARGNDEFMNSEVVAVNKFRKAMSGEPEYIGTQNDDEVVTITRGNRGMAIVNLSTNPRILSTSTTLADGTYIDKAHGKLFQVKNGQILEKLSPETSYIIYK